MPPSRTSDSADSGSKGKKRGSYTKKACQQCKRRRAKCDGAHPGCSTCTRYDDQCSYADGHDQRATPSKHQILALQERVRLLEKQLSLRDDHGDQWPVGEGDVDQDQQSEPAAASRNSLKRDDASRGFIVYGVTSALHHLTSPASPLSSSVAGTSVSHGSPSVASLGNTTSYPLESGWRCNLPHLGLPGGTWDDGLHDHVLDTFFNVYNNWYGIVNEPAFRRDMTTCLADPSSSSSNRTSSYSLLLHYALLGLGCWNCDDPRTFDSSVSAWFIERAQTFLNVEGEHPTLSTLQGLLVIGNYYTCANRPNLGFLYAGVAIRACSTLGLEIDCKAHVQRDEMTEETYAERVRTFWACFLIDQRWSAYLGRAPTLSLNSIKIGLPAINELEDSKLWVPPSPYLASLPPTRALNPCPSLRSTNFHWTARLALLEHRILTTIYGSDVNVHSKEAALEASGINLALEDWFNSLPHGFRITPQIVTPPPSHIILTNIMFHFLIILLHRPWYLQPDDDNSSGSSASKRCNTAATRIISLLGLYHRSPGLRYTTVALVQFTFSAATTSLLAMVHAQQHDQLKKAATAHKAFDACLHYLQAAGNPCCTAQQCHAILTDLLKDHGLSADSPDRTRVEEDDQRSLGPDHPHGGHSAAASLSRSSTVVDPPSLPSFTLDDNIGVFNDLDFGNLDLDAFMLETSWSAPPSFPPPPPLAPVAGSLNAASPAFPYGWIDDVQALIAGHWPAGL